VGFQLVDRLVAYERWAWGRATKLAAAGDPYWRASGGEVVLPPALVVESLCQAGNWFLFLFSERRSRGALLSIGSIEVTGSVHPGDLMELLVESSLMSDDVLLLSGEVRVGGRLVLRVADILVQAVDAATLEDPDAAGRRVDLLLRPA
jgi:3-hydroxyacyl-[acyl-carrier-protein] dehydratase